MPISKIIPNYLRITNAGRTPGAFLTAQIIASPHSQLKMGKIYVVLEIAHPTTSTRQIGQTILNTLQHSYFQGDSTSDLQNFEKALKTVNETLAQIAQSGETNWIGNMNAVFCLLVNNEAHIATSGRAQAWLIREGKISEIVDSQLLPLQPHPLKTFSAVTSGSLIPGDRLLLNNPKLQNYLSAQQIKEAIDGISLQEVGERLIKILKNLKEKTISVFVLEIPPRHSPEQPSKINLYLDQPTDSPLNHAIKFSKKYLLPWAAHTSRQAAEYFKSGITSSRKIIGTARRKAKDYSVKTKPRLKQIHTKTKELVSHKFSSQAVPPETSYKDANIIGRSIYTINDYRANHPLGAKKIVKRFVSAVKKSLYTLDNQIFHFKSWLVKNKKRPFALIIGALLLIIILIVSVSFQRKKQAEKAIAEQQTQTMAAARQKLEEGKTALVLSDKETAAILFEKAIQLAEKLSDSDLKDSAKEVITQASNQADAITQTTRVREADPFVKDLSARVLFAYQGNAFALSDKEPKIIKINILSGDKNTINQIEPIQGAWRQAVKVNDKHFYLLTSQGNIYDFNAQEESLKKLGLKDEQLKKAVDLDLFAGNLYVLSPEDAQVWKYLPAEGGAYQNPLKYAQRSLAKVLKKSRALAIDGAIYLLSKGQIIKMSRGTKANFKIKNMPKAFEDLSEAVDIFTNENIPSIYLLDKTKPRIVEFDKTGAYLHQYLLPPSIKNPQSFQIDHIGKKAWILADNKGYEIDL